jgi:pumilio family protein 6
LKQELYGPHFSLFSADKILGGLAVPTLKSNLESASTTDTQKQAATTFVKDILSKGMTKSFFGYTYFQELFAEYMEVADAGDIRTMAPSVVDHSIHLLSTRAGTKVVAACASYGTPKDRKRICKSLKGYMKSSLLHKDAYMAVLRLCQVTDDTVSIHKSLLNEILTVPTPKSTSIDDEEGESESPLLELALDENASKLFLMLLLEDDEARNKYFDPSYEQAILEEQPMVKENGELVPTSKKDPNARRLELLQYLNQGLIELCTNHAEELLESLPGSRVLKEVYSTIAPQEVVDATIQVCVASFDEKTDEEDASLSLFEDPVSHRSIKNLILSDEKNEKPLFAQAFVEQLGDRLMDISASNRGAFVVAALFKIPSVKPKALAKLKSGVKKLKELSKQKGATAGYDALLKEIS